jgi:hypothetical protein
VALVTRDTKPQMSKKKKGKQGEVRAALNPKGAPSDLVRPQQVPDVGANIPPLKYDLQRARTCPIGITLARSSRATVG